jgi:hypothetical protein
MPVQLTRFSLSYDPAEDRIAWDAEAAGGALVRLWLTQRLCRELVAALTPRLPRPAATAPAGREAAVQSWEQAAAMASFGKTPGVTYTAEAVSGLVRTVHINPSPQNVTLVFEASEGEPAAITLDAVALRQMLAILRQLHAGAGWPLETFPAWVAEPPSTDSAAALN